MRLLVAASPSAIIFFVISIVVNAVKSEFGVWPYPHICQKVLERMKPSFADCYPSSAVVRVLLEIWIKAATLHILPGAIFRRCFSVNRCAMDSHLVAFIASTTLGMTIAKIGAPYYALVITIATAQPICLMFDVGKSNDRPSAKTKASQIFYAGREWGRIGKHWKLILSDVGHMLLEQCVAFCVIGSLYHGR